MKVKAVVKRPDEAYGHMTNVSISLKNLQSLVGGHIEPVAVDKGVIILCNEEGKLKGLEPNMRIPGDILHGDIVALGAAGEDFTDIPISFSEWKALVDEYRR